MIHKTGNIRGERRQVPLPPQTLSADMWKTIDERQQQIDYLAAAQRQKFQRCCRIVNEELVGVRHG